MDRRQFIKTFAIATACSSLSGRTWNEVIAAEVRLLSTGNTGELTIKLSDFPALLEESGSVRFAVHALRGNASSSITPDGQFYPVIVNRGPNDTFHTLNSRCTHMGCVVDALNSATNLMTCPCHGSIYSIDGKRISGRATGPLTTLTSTFDGQDSLTVEVPGLGYSVIASRVRPESGSAPRLRLEFRAFRNVKYEVHFRELLRGNATLVPFSTSESGPVAETVYAPTANAAASLFVEQGNAHGFYSVAVRVAEV